MRGPQTCEKAMESCDRGNCAETAERRGEEVGGDALTMAPMSISRVIRHWAKTKPDDWAIRCGELATTFADLERDTNRLARAYAGMGIEAGDIITIGLPNSLEFYRACIALWKLGATPQPVSYRLPKGELKQLLALYAPRFVIGLDASESGASPSLAARFGPDAAISDEPLPDVVSKNWKAMTSGGSTGRPKLIVSHLPGEVDLGEPSEFGLLPGEVQLVPGPLYHNGPFLFSMTGLFRGHQLVVMPKFDAADCLRLMTDFKVNWMFTVPTMMQRIWRLGEEARRAADLSAVRTILHSASPCPEWLKEDWIGWIGGERLAELYGGTEGIGGTWITGTEWLQHRGSVGRPMKGSTIKVVDPEGQSVPPGGMGEIYLLPEAVVERPYHYIGATSKVTDDGWETLGDLGYFDEDGYLYLCDRRVDLIISGGANIFPAEVEAAINSHPAVSSCAVVGIPHEDLGQAVHAIVQADKSLTRDDLLDYLADQLVRYKIPRTIELVNYAVRDDAGKARRTALATEQHE